MLRTGASLCTYPHPVSVHHHLLLQIYPAAVEPQHIQGAGGCRGSGRLLRSCIGRSSEGMLSRIIIDKESCCCTLPDPGSMRYASLHVPGSHPAEHYQLFRPHGKSEMKTALSWLPYRYGCCRALSWVMRTHASPHSEHSRILRAAAYTPCGGVADEQIIDGYTVISSPGGNLADDDLWMSEK